MTSLDETERLVRRLSQAIRRVNVGAPASFSIDKQAGFVLKKIGAGGVVSLENPSTVRRAIRAMENYRG